MNANPAAPSNASDREIVLARVVNAPREAVWDAFTDPQKVVKWWGPKGFTDTTREMEVRAGGRWHHVMHGPDGTDYPNMNKFTEVVKGEKLAYGADPEMGDQGGHCPATWTFEDAGPGKTRVTGRLNFPTKEIRDQVVKDNNAIVGGNQTLDRLEGFVAGKTCKEDFVMGRTFEAPLALVWDCFTDPKHMAWWGPKGVTTQVVKNELTPGGIRHYYMEMPDGKRFWGKQVFREIVPNEKLVCVGSFSDEKGGITRHPLSPDWPLELVTAITFKAEGPSRTRVVVRWTPIDARENEWKAFDDGRSSMRGGWGGSFEDLDAYLAERRRKA